MHHHCTWGRLESFSRRDILRKAALGAGVLALGALRPAAAVAGLPSPLACRQSSYGKFEAAAWTHLPTIGIHHLFLSVPPEAEVASTMARLATSGLTPLVMRGGADLSQESSVAELAAQLAICERMGVGYMFLSPKHGDAPKETAYARLREAGEVAKAHKVIISLETHPDLGTNGDVHLETMRQVDHPNVRVNFDTGNITYYNQGGNAVEELKKVLPYLATVELKDHNGELESWTFPVLGKGNVDLKGVIEVLDENGYSGPVTLEFEGVRGIDLDEAQTLKAIEDSVAYLRTLRKWM